MLLLVEDVLVELEVEEVDVVIPLAGPWPK